MYCKYLKKKINGEVWCKRNNQKCYNCNNKEYVTNCQAKIKLRQKSKKLAKLEKNRFSILTSDLDHCIICGVKKDNLHEVFFGTANRTKSMVWGCVIPLCFAHHTEMHKNIEWQKHWHIEAEKKFLYYYNMTKDDFRKIFGKNYLD